MPFHKVAVRDELEPNSVKCVNPDGRQIALARVGDDYYAVDDRCPHRGGQLCDGALNPKSGEIVCSLHKWNFDLKTGVSPYNPHDKVQTFKTETREDGVYIEVPESSAHPELTDYLDPWRRRTDDIEEEMEMIHHKRSCE